MHMMMESARSVTQWLTSIFTKIFPEANCESIIKFVYDLIAILNKVEMEHKKWCHTSVVYKFAPELPPLLSR